MSFCTNLGQLLGLCWSLQRVHYKKDRWGEYQYYTAQLLYVYHIDHLQYPISSCPTMVIQLWKESNIVDRFYLFFAQGIWWIGNRHSFHKCIDRNNDISFYKNLQFSFKDVRFSYWACAHSHIKFHLFWNSDLFEYHSCYYHCIHSHSYLCHESHRNETSALGLQ